MLARLAAELGIEVCLDPNLHELNRARNELLKAFPPPLTASRPPNRSRLLDRHPNRGDAASERSGRRAGRRAERPLSHAQSRLASGGQAKLVRADVVLRRARRTPSEGGRASADLEDPEAEHGRLYLFEDRFLFAMAESARGDDAQQFPVQQHFGHPPSPAHPQGHPTTGHLKVEVRATRRPVAADSRAAVMISST